MKTSWPPPYTLKKNPRAKRVRVRASLQEGLEIIIPSRFNIEIVPTLLEHHRSWIEKNLSPLLLKHQSRMLIPLPDILELPAVSKRWQLHYLPSTSKLSLIARPSQEIVFTGNISKKRQCLILLRRFLRSEAERDLIAELGRLSQETGLVFQKASIRAQTRRWGSCTTKKAISLNYKLLYFPRELMLHVLLHELCHTVHMNHSAVFWQLLARFDPQWKEHRRALRKAEAFIPCWDL